MIRCSICKLPAASGLLRNECIKDPFRVEELRTVFAKRNRLKDLEETYREDFAEISDINSPEFWNKLLVENEDREKKSPLARDRIKTVTKVIGKLQGKLLDVGFGHGFIEEHLSTGVAFDLHGIDISSRAVERLNRILSGDFKVGSILKIPFSDDFFDVVLALEILEHIPPHNTFVAINELYRVLKVGGTFVISVPLNEGLEEMIREGVNLSGHVRVYTSELIKAELKIGKFKIQQEKYLFAFKDFYWLKNLLQKTLLKNRWQPNIIIVSAIK